ncbi:MAG: FMN-binding protein [Clostridiales bacterium]|jgi:electron transport complex protein RnfG|nr:FMN-binding protein [Clostridiales bacterium]
MSDIMKIGFRLFVITAIAAIVMGLTNLATEEPIRLQRIKAENKARQVALPQAEEFGQLDIEGGSWGNEAVEIVEIYTGLSDDKVVGYVFRVKAMGYVGDMDIILGINTDDEIEAVEIGEHSETPGLGAKVKDKAFLEQFHGKGTEAQLSAVKTLNEDGSADTSGSSTVDAEGSATTDTESSATVDTEAGATADTEAGATADTEDSATTDTEGSATTDTESSATVDGSSSATGGASGSVQEIQAISGATVTSGAVTRAINLALQYYNAILINGGGN